MLCRAISPKPILQNVQNAVGKSTPPTLMMFTDKTMQSLTEYTAADRPGFNPCLEWFPFLCQLSKNNRLGTPRLQRSTYPSKDLYGNMKAIMASYGIEAKAFMDAVDWSTSSKTNNEWIPYMVLPTPDQMDSKPTLKKNLAKGSLKSKT